MPDAPDDSFAALFEKTGSAGTPRRGARVGETLSVVVVQTGRDAVFVELEGHRQGFIEASHLRAPDGTLKVAVGQRLQARVVRVDAESGIELAPTVAAAVAAGASVGVGSAAGVAGPGALPRASEQNAVKIALGQVVSGSVDRIESYGIFVQIDGTKGRAGRGLVPTGELGVPRGADLRKALSLGSKIKAKVIELAEGRIRLSVTALKDDEERAQFEGFREKGGKADAPQSLGTLGDLLKKKL